MKLVENEDKLPNGGNFDNYRSVEWRVRPPIDHSSSSSESP